ncbi:hypothetical protein ACOSP7_010079 [Xanthoceras sorbifolium]
MAERVPPPDSSHHPPSLDPTTPAFRPGTFIVRVPKGQIYRVPPPENALIVESHNTVNNKGRPCCSWFCCVLIIVILVLAVGLVIGLVCGLVL